VELLAQFLIDDSDADALCAAEFMISRHGTIAATLDHLSQGRELPDCISSLSRKRLGELTDLLAGFLRQSIPPTLALDHVEAVAAYLKPEMAALPVEIFRVMFLDGANRLIEDRTMWVGTVDRVQVHIREVIRRALAVDAVALIVAHNHVSTPPAPSEQDITLTSRLLEACATVELRINDHVIVSREGCFSMRAGGVLDRLERNRRSQMANAA
jgi:DNA repair protein RadC